MHRTSILVPVPLRDEAEAEAKRQGITLSELIRRLLAATVARSKPTGRDADPLFRPGKLMGRGGAGDIAARHDDYLYGPIRKARGK